MNSDSRYPPKKLGKGPKSCHNCRRAKQRCDIPSRTSILPSKSPQPQHLSCHRCNMLKLPCIIDVSLPAQEGVGETSSSSSPGDAAVRAKGKRDRSSGPSNSAKSRQRIKSRSSDKQEEILVDRGLQTSGVQIFDPQYNSLFSEASKRNTQIPPEEQPFFDLKEYQVIITSFRPFTFLRRMCALHPDFLAPAGSHKKGLQNRPLRWILDRYSSQLDWNELNKHLQAYQLFLPFIEDVWPARFEDEDNGSFWMATRVLLAAGRTNLDSLYIDLLAFVRQQAEVVLAQGASNMGEVAALLALALYEPLLLVKSVDEIQWDGDRFLPAIIHTSRAMGLNKVYLQMQTFDFKAGHSPLALLRQGALWYRTALYVAQLVLWSHLSRRYDIDCPWQELEDVEHFSKRCLEMPNAHEWAHQASMLLVLITRYRMLRDFGEHARRICVAQEALPVDSDSFIESAGLLTQSLNSFQEGVEASLEQMQLLRRSLALPESTRSLFLDYVEYEMMQAYITCLQRIQEVIFLRILLAWNEPISVASILSRLRADSNARSYLDTIVFRRQEQTRMLIVLLVNFTCRWSQDVGSRLVLIAPPPGFVCAVMLPNLKSMCQIVDQANHDNSVPRNCLADKALIWSARLCRNLSEILYSFARPQSTEVYHGKGHRDIFQMTAGIAVRTAKAMHEWLAAQKGLRGDQERSGAALQSSMGYANIFTVPPMAVNAPHLNASSSQNAVRTTAESKQKGAMQNPAPYVAAAPTASPSTSSPLITASQPKAPPSFYYAANRFNASPPVYRDVPARNRASPPPPPPPPPFFAVQQSPPPSHYFSEIQNFERLLEDILATPVV